MAAAATVLNQHTAALAGAPAPMASSNSGTTGSSSSSDDSATITANDFLTLLVTEMQNQDPTADTDPNAYINQLVEVNSLEQLIDINQTLTTAYPSTATDSTKTPSTKGAAGPEASVSGGRNTAAAQGSAAVEAGSPGSAAEAPGNLSVPSSSAAAQRVGHALNGRTRAHPAVAPPPIP